MSRVIGALLVLFTLVASVLVQPARADQILTQETVLFSGTDAQTVSLGDPGAGTITIVLTDLAWPTKLASLSFSLSSESTVLMPVTAGSNTFSVTGAGALYAHISGVAESLGIPGLPSFGLFSLQIDFSPPAPPVPLPESLWLLLSALGGLLGIQVLRGSTAQLVTALPTPGG